MTIDPGFASLSEHDFVVEYNASSTIGRYEPSDEAIRWGAELVVHREASRVVLAWAELVVVRLGRTSPSDVLDSDADLARFVPLLGPEGDDFDERYCSEGFGDGLVIANRLSVQPAFRGKGFGPLLLAFSLLDLAGDCGVAALEPAPFELDGEDPTYVSEQQRLQRLWTAFGFTIWDNGLATIDLATNAVREAAAGAKARLERLLDE